MIISDFLVLNDYGLYCRTGDFYLDPKAPVFNAVISHAHGDHAVPGNENIYCTGATSAIMNLRYKRNAGNNFTICEFNHSFLINGVEITFIPAGHILGSAQVLLQYKGIKYLYTGDYKLQADETCEPIEFSEADVLITETTFADPDVQHPDPVSEIEKLNLSEHNVLLGAYSLGKAQRLINLISVHCPQRKILVHHAILPLNKIYENYNYLPGKYEPYNRKLMKTPGQNYVYLVPPMTFDSYFRAKNVVRAFASGWKRLQQNNDLEIYISDHVDWNDILAMISEVKPKEIWTLHGDGTKLKEYFNNQIPIKILNKC
ncbi:MBL fold metallo-hydrolase [Daejeonella oryzae]|uniref:MBL fold metallo-hydrolase n=1 Tax=Daejeonella oryzae TaxID=1122943 RepID=UPI000416209E|nr:MBL fold metallo-hydrolase [Daejeonella oryzae]